MKSDSSGDKKNKWNSIFDSGAGSFWANTSGPDGTLNMEIWFMQAFIAGINSIPTVLSMSFVQKDDIGGHQQQICAVNMANPRGAIQSMVIKYRLWNTM